MSEAGKPLAVFMTSTLFWYEREAEIMLTILLGPR